MAKNKNGRESNETVVALAENWQRCRAGDLPALFTAYDTKEKQSERVVSFQLNVKTVEKLYKQSKPEKGLRYIVHLGLRKESYSETVPDNTPFVLLIQAYHGPDDYQKKCHELAWMPNSKFSNSIGTKSEANAIPAAGAYLFVHKWMETPADELADVFQSKTYQQDLRVQAYIFSYEESLSIRNDMITDGGTYNEVCIHLGDGIAVTGHPFSFRPVLEVKNAVDPEKPGKTGRSMTGLSDETGNSYYDYATPIPPPPRGD